MKVPRLDSASAVVRYTTDPQEIDMANRLVFRNYVADGFWEDDEDQLRRNKFLHTPARHVFVAFEEGRLVGTISILLDSEAGLPSDSTQSALMRSIRNKGGKIAEVSAFATERGRKSHRTLVLFLISYMFQYSFYYAGVDRLVASCKPEHADFYESVLCFSKVSDLTYYDYSHAAGYLITLDLHSAHWLLSQRHPPDPVTGRSFYRFLLRDPQPCQYFAPDLIPVRSRHMNWIEHGIRKVA